MDSVIQARWAPSSPLLDCNRPGRAPEVTRRALSASKLDNTEPAHEAQICCFFAIHSCFSRIDRQLRPNPKASPYNSRQINSKICALKFHHLFLYLALGLTLGVAHGENADKDKPMNIEADELVHDDLNQLTVFTGRVLVTKGTLVLKGERIEVREDPQGFQYGVITPERGKRAYYRQKREAVNEFMEGEALRIEYDGRLDRVTLMDQAVLRRYRGTMLNDEMSGQLITYDHLSETFRVGAQQALVAVPAARANGLGKSNPSQDANTPSGMGLLATKKDTRVRAVLTPVPSVPALQNAAPSPVSPGTSPVAPVGQSKP